LRTIVERGRDRVPGPESTARVFPEVHRTALAYRLTSYDAAYLELAIRRGRALATLDDDLRKAAAAAGVALV
jgi:predicted nucleic acid-binding protein